MPEQLPVFTAEEWPGEASPRRTIVISRGGGVEQVWTVRFTWEMRFTRLVRVLALMVVGMTLLSACSMLGRSTEVPEGDAWREDVAKVIAATPGVEQSDVTVHDVDNGMTKGPVMTGTVVIAAGKDAQRVVDAAMRAAADFMGEESSGVGARPGITRTGERPGHLDDYAGYERVNTGEDLWQATR